MCSPLRCFRASLWRAYSALCSGLHGRGFFSLKNNNLSAGTHLGRTTAKKRLRRGFTTGTCAAAGAKAAAYALFGVGAPLRVVEVTLPGGDTLPIEVKSVKVEGGRARAVIVKDAGDDPDVTHRAEVVTEGDLVRRNDAERARLVVKGG